jgi:hypothetical protein
VPGGIPTNRNHLIDVTQAPYNANNTGAANASPAIQNAINAAASGDVIYLPAGTYKIGDRLWPKAGTTIRGHGWDTILDMGSGADFLFRGNESRTNACTISGDVAKGTSTLTVSSSSGLAVGNLIRIWQDSDITTPLIMSVWGQSTEPAQSQWTMVTGKPDGTHVTISPALIFDLHASFHPAIYKSLGVITGAGLENLKLDGTNKTTGGAMVQMWAASGCWLYNVWSYKGYGYHMVLDYGAQNEIRHCRIELAHTVGPNNSGLKIDASSSLLIVDNILLDLFPAVEINGGVVAGDGGTSGIVVAYNFVRGCPTGSPELVGYGIDDNHGAFTQYQLFEGNVCEKLIADAYYGGSNGHTALRNWFFGIDPDPARTSDVSCVRLGRFSRDWNIVGNLLGMRGYTFTVDAGTSANYTTHYIYQLGYPNSSNDGYSGTAQPSRGDWWANWGTGPGPSGFQELDLDVRATTLIKGNYNTQDAGIPASESLGDATLPNSLFLSSKPSWFGDLAWPAFDPNSPNMNFDAIPAGYRYVHGVDAPGVPAQLIPPPSPAQPPVNAKTQIQAR